VCPDSQPTPLRLLGIGTRPASFITVDWDFWVAVSLMLCMAPVNNLALGAMPPHKIKNASDLFNLMCNLGGGLALINTAWTCISLLRESVTWSRQVAVDTLANMTRALAALGSDAELAATTSSPSSCAGRRRCSRCRTCSCRSP
jgi:DHA2 family multidrug resistance protein